MNTEGTEGKQGKQGTQGVQGSQGVQGLQGPQGEGHTGEAGPQGERGKSGTPFRDTRVTGSFVALAVIFFAVAISQWYTIREQRQLTRELETEIFNRCEDGRINRVAIRSSLADGMSALGYKLDAETNTLVKVGPPIAYYREHPAELDDALTRSRAALERFPPITCQKL